MEHYGLTQDIIKGKDYEAIYDFTMNVTFICYVEAFNESVAELLPLVFLTF